MIDSFEGPINQNCDIILTFFGSFLAQNWPECQGFAVTFLKGTFWLEKGKFLTIAADLA